MKPPGTEWGRKRCSVSSCEWHEGSESEWKKRNQDRDITARSRTRKSKSEQSEFMTVGLSLSGLRLCPSIFNTQSDKIKHQPLQRLCAAALTLQTSLVYATQGTDRFSFNKQRETKKVLDLANCFIVSDSAECKVTTLICRLLRPL